MAYTKLSVKTQEVVRKVKLYHIVQLIIGLLLGELWIYFVSHGGGILPALDEIESIIVLFLFQLLVIFTAHDIQDLWYEGGWFRFITCLIFLWTVPVLFTLQVLQSINLWLPLVFYIGLQLFFLVLYFTTRKKLVRRTSDEKILRLSRGQQFLLAVLLIVVVGGVFIISRGKWDAVRWIQERGLSERRETERHAEQYFEEGLKLFQEGHFLLAQEQLEKAIRHDPRNALAQNYLGFVYASIGMERRAVHAFKKAIWVEPDSLGHHINLGKAYQQMGKLDMARQEWEYVLKRNPGNEIARMLLDMLPQSME